VKSARSRSREQETIYMAVVSGCGGFTVSPAGSLSGGPQLFQETLPIRFIVKIPHLVCSSFARMALQ
jgi:hypothetical protein